MFRTIKSKSIYFISFSIFLIIGLFLLALFTKEEIFLFVNGNHSPFLDDLFRYGTDLGKGSIYIILIVATLFMKYRYTLTTCLAVIVETTLVQVPKKILFPDMLRPIKYFADLPNLHIVDGVRIHSHYSFPSGHTAVAFCVFTLMTLFVNRKDMEVPFLFLALFVGYSRIYLVQHFFLDVYVGAVISVCSALFSFWMINANPFFSILNRGGLDGHLMGSNLLKVFTKRP